MLFLGHVGCGVRQVPPVLGHPNSVSHPLPICTRAPTELVDVLCCQPCVHPKLSLVGTRWAVVPEDGLCVFAVWCLGGARTPSW